VPFDLTSSISQVNKPRLDRIRRHPKLVDAESVLTEFRRGDPVTRVIITLKPSAEADDLAAQSQRAADIPAEFQHQGAPVFYDLANQVIRTQLRERVRERVAQVIDHNDIPGVEVTQRFSYQFGYAALVTDAGLEQLLADPDVIRVERDWVLEAHTEQGIPLMNAAAPSSSYNGSGLSIAICDTGIDTSHPRLGGGGFPNSKVIGGYDTGDNDSDPRPGSNGNAHGTACAGIAAGDLDSVGDYVGGVAPGAKLYSIKISYGTGGSAYTSDMIEGWEWAIRHQNDDPTNPIQIISTSFGGGRYYNQGTCDSATPAMTTAAANAVAAGITIFVSSGNNGYCSSMGWPACISYVNSVGAVYDASLGTLGWCVSYDSACTTRASANTGCSSGYAAFDSSVADKVTAYSNSASFLSLFAPSNNAYTTDIVGSGGYSTGDYTTGFGGTSAACPYAAGAAAVLQHAAKAKTGTFLTPAQVREHLTTHGDLITDGKISTVTKPRINLARAVNALSSTGQTPSLSIDDISLNEGNSGTTSFTFTVMLSAASFSTVTVNYATAAGSAAASSDFTSTSGTLTFDTGETIQTLTVPITGDTVSEPNEIFYVNLSSPAGATLADSQGVGSIVNDDVSPALSISDVSLTEGNSGTKIFAFTVTLTPNSTGTVTVRYATANGTATTSNRDYSSTSGTLSFNAGATSKTVNVSVRGDTRRENNETFYLNLSSASGASFADSQGLGTIVNDD
jgi:subtilisin family serine protease